MKYKWRYLDGYIPQKKTTALHVGEVLHLAFDSFFNGSSDKEVEKDIVAYMDNIIAETEPELQEDFIIQKYTLLGMWKGYPFKDLSIFNKYDSEHEIRLSLSPDLKFICKVDRVLTVKKTGLTWLGELKTSGVPFHQFVNRLGTSSQASAYVWALRKIGIPVSGLLYDYVKKPLLRKGSNENCHEYGKRIQEDYFQRPSNYFSQHYEYRTDLTIKMFEEDMMKMVKMIEFSKSNDCLYRNQNNCWTYNYECPYKKICFSEYPDPLTLELYFRKPEINNEDGKEVDNV